MEHLFDKMRRMHAALDGAGIPYRIVGGMGVFLQVCQADPDNARLTRDVDLAIHRSDLARIIAAAESAGFQYRHAVGVDMLLDAANPKGVAIHLLFAHELVEPAVTAEGYLVAPVSDLVRMKLTSFRLKDKVHIQDMDNAGLITAEIEQSLSEALRQRLREVRATR